MRGLVLAVALAALVGAGCVELPRLDTATCGNGVIDRELGEDCDGFADPALGEALKCDACHYVCGTENLCPLGWGCGTDGVCAQPSGVFGLPVDEVPIAANRLELGEIDGDGRLDLLAHGGHRIFARFGDGAGHLVEPIEVAIDVSVDTLATGDLDLDADRDVVIPVPSGIVTLLGDGRDLAPVTYKVYESQAPRGLVMTPIAYDPASPFVGVLIVAASPDTVYLSLAALSPAPPLTAFAIPEAHAIDELAVLQTLRLAPAESESIVLGFRGETRLRVFATSPAPPYITARAEIPLPGALGTDHVLVVDVDGNGALDLVVPLAAGGIAIVPGNGAGGFGAAVVDARFTALGGAVLAAADLDGDRDADWVTPRGVFIDDGGALEQTAWNVSEADWTIAATPDLDGDGIHDVVATTGTLALDVLRGTPSGFFVRANVVTEGIPTALAVADYDGDGRDDVGMIEEHPDEVAITVMFGESGEQPPPVEMGDLPFAARLAPALIRVGTSTTDATSDLFVQTYDAEGADQSQALVLFVGSSARRMPAPFNLGDDPTLITIGNIQEDDLAAPDVLALTAGGAVLASGDGQGGFTAIDTYAAGLPFDPRDPERLGLTTRDLDTDGVDEVLALLPPNPLTSMPARLVIGRLDGVGPARRFMVDLIDLPDVVPVRAPLFADVDDDGAVDLIVLEPTAVRVYWGTAGGFDLATPSRHELGAAALSVTTLQLDVDAPRELAVGTPDSVTLVDTEARALTLLGGLFTGSRCHLVAAGDLTGDGLDDLVVHDGFDLLVFPAVPAGVAVPEPLPL